MSMQFLLCFISNAYATRRLATERMLLGVAIRCLQTSTQTALSLVIVLLIVSDFGKSVEHVDEKEGWE